MLHEGLAGAQRIRVEVRHDKGRLLVATSPDLPRFQVIGLSHEELEHEVPVAIRTLYKLRHDRDVEVIALESKGTPDLLAYEARTVMGTGRGIAAG